ncbi:MAG TPA: hypothetical protein EYP29_02045 [Thermoplasmata archaeon]|nr:hypothetical protein [Thermoplasmata archaeon]
MVDKEDLIHRVKPKAPTQMRAHLPLVVVRCPQCQNPLKITTPVRPYNFRCLRCQASLRIERDNSIRVMPFPSAPRGVRGTPPYSPSQPPVVIRCPTCLIPIKITSPLRPYTFSCPGCGTAITLK